MVCGIFVWNFKRELNEKERENLLTNFRKPQLCK